MRMDDSAPGECRESIYNVAGTVSGRFDIWLVLCRVPNASIVRPITKPGLAHLGRYYLPEVQALGQRGSATSVYRFCLKRFARLESLFSYEVLASLNTVHLTILI